MENTRQESPETPDTPNAENYYPSTPDIASNYGDDHVVAQIKPLTPQSEDRSLTSIKKENSLLLVKK